MCRVKHPLSPARSARILATAVAVALVLGGCGTQQQEKVTADPTVSLPTESVSAPPGVTLTEPGTELKVGETATVGFAPNAKRSTALRLKVRRINQGRISDLSRYDLNRAAKASTPYYVKVGVANVGDGQIGRSAIPLWGLADDDTLIGASGFTTSFTKCPSGPLPRALRQGRLDAHLPDVPDAARQQAGRGQLPAGDGRGSDRLEGHRRQARQEEDREEGVVLTSRTFAPLRLGPLQVDTPVVLAPMAGITNAAYRRLCAEQGAGLYVCEMITSRGLVEGDATTRQMLVFDDSEDRPLGPALRHRPDVRRQGDRDPVRRVRRRPTSTSTSAAPCPR